MGGFLNERMCLQHYTGLVQELFTETTTITQLAAEFGIHPNQLGVWKASAPS